jgi:GTP-binding protein HflX
MTALRNRTTPDTGRALPLPAYHCEIPGGGTRAILVHMDLESEARGQERGEFGQLAHSAGAIPVATVTSGRSTADARYFLGSGKVEEIQALVEARGAQVVLVDHALSASQERNLERALRCRVVDRTGLILDIFAQRARTFEGKLQVELAQLRHMSTRLVRGWTHLERQKGGIGLRGPGETQLETDRRLIGVRIRQLDRRLEKVHMQREQGRRARRKAQLPTVALVGYTNSGKSTLFNGLTGASVFAADKLFSTLDPTLRRVEVGEGAALILADTVGFIHRLPYDLVAAFRSTLEETLAADLLLHVIDTSEDRREFHIQQVNTVLEEIGAGAIRQIEVHNKIDVVNSGPRVERGADGQVKRIWVSAATGAGLKLIKTALAEHVAKDEVRGFVRVPPDAGKARARLFALGEVLSEKVNEQGESVMEIRLPRRSFEQWCRQEGSRIELISKRPLQGAAHADSS